MDTYAHMWIHVDTYGGPRAKPWPQTGGPAAARPAGPAGAAKVHPSKKPPPGRPGGGRAASFGPGPGPVWGQGLALGPPYVQHVCICVQL